MSGSFLEDVIWCEMEDLKEELKDIFEKCGWAIYRAYSPAKISIQQERKERKEQKTNIWIESKTKDIPNSDHKHLLTACLRHVYTKQHAWFYYDDMPQSKDEMATLLLKTPFHILLESYADTICDNCR